MSMLIFNIRVARHKALLSRIVSTNMFNPMFRSLRPIQKSFSEISILRVFNKPPIKKFHNSNILKDITSKRNATPAKIAWQAMTTREPFLVYQAKADKKISLIYLLTVGMLINVCVITSFASVDIYRAKDEIFANWVDMDYYEKLSYIGSAFITPALYFTLTLILFLPRRNIYSISTLPSQRFEIVTGFLSPFNKLYFSKSLIVPRKDVSIVTYSLQKNPITLKIRDRPFYYLLNANGKYAGNSKDVLFCVIGNRY
ncbi:mitochondrial membrane protein, human TMEM186 ortholog, implicated in respiratory complex assembly [Schizosaccharomyces pombe]|uniref:Uncharacterized membrane protein P22H7.04 n=1 Tax=Schizosaccharomyces pombe (strain 972 / ATCC 24843) TaxID=284812 RepID=YHI4_SCHPO|nr:uncharacterized protein SPBP22H7.04 [Schizosaccharomyces pombe]Q9C0W3.1 RecName: Full=Uncharacterized membrane protein P22H7.04 [Schizosaccharomyces pombe 972h-]CAC37372.1 sequence orphan [Schizosaccharomyces pombe]|eukprot:NP_001342990.1 uncharacterized protein SPBP22H7.04 [Schizosaccharomyces pombe]